jgi:hypothetical protein
MRPPAFGWGNTWSATAWPLNCHRTSPHRGIKRFSQELAVSNRTPGRSVRLISALGSANCYPIYPDNPDAVRSWPHGIQCHCHVIV